MPWEDNTAETSHLSTQIKQCFLWNTGNHLPDYMVYNDIKMFHMNYQTIMLQPTLPQSKFATLKTPNLIKNGKVHYILEYTQFSKHIICNLVHPRNKPNDAKLNMLQTTEYTYINNLCILMNIQLSELKYTNLTYPHVQFMPILQRQHNLTQSWESYCLQKCFIHFFSQIT
jgi:hypothetical protein